MEIKVFHYFLVIFCKFSKVKFLNGLTMVKENVLERFVRCIVYFISTLHYLLEWTLHYLLEWACITCVNRQAHVLDKTYEGAVANWFIEFDKTICFFILLKLTYVKIHITRCKFLHLDIETIYRGLFLTFMDVHKKLIWFVV